jgi:hypothetical protein
MTQRAGSVCGTPPCLQVYLRTSPLVCLCDTLVLSARIFADVVFKKTNLGEAARQVVRARTGAPLQVDNMRFINWVAYALGVLPAYIKLLGFEQMPWTSAWASMYVASYVAVEVLFVLGAGDGPEKKVVKEKDESASTPAPTSPKNDDFSIMWDRLTRFSGLVALLFHLALLIWTSYSIFGQYPQPLKLELLAPYPAFGVLPPYLAFGQWIFVFVVMRPSDYPSSDDMYHRLGLKDNGLSLFMALFLAASLMTTALCIPFCLFLLPLGLLLEAWAVLFVLSLVLSKMKALSEQVFLAQDDYKVQACAVWSLSMVTTGVMVWWYALRYRPEGTFKPEWTNVFG